MRRPAHLMSLARRGWHHRDWYEVGLAAAIEAAGELSTTHHRLINVLAITSPRCTVTRNARVTVRYLRDGSLPRDVTRSTRAALTHYEGTGEIRGPKTSKFAAALKGDDDAIVLDTWMARALGVDQKIFATKWGRSVSERRIRYCAHVMGVTPRQFQAACWSGTVLKAGPARNVPRLDTALLEEIYK